MSQIVQAVNTFKLFLEGKIQIGVDLLPLLRIPSVVSSE